MKNCIVIPVLNEAKAIGKLVEDLVKKKIVVIVVDDGSIDDSGSIAKKAGAIVLRHELRKGKGYSLRAGFEYALENGYENIITMDGDGQHAPEDVDLFLDAAKEKSIGIIIGNRMADSKKMPLIRLMTNWLLSSIISLACGQKIFDSQCGFRLIKAEILKEITLQCNQYDMETEILMRSSKKDFKIKSVNIKTIYSAEESHIDPFRDTIRFITFFFKELFSK